MSRPHNTQNALHWSSDVFVQSVRKLDHHDGTLPRCAKKPASDGSTGFFTHFAKEYLHEIKASTGEAGGKTDWSHETNFEVFSPTPPHFSHLGPCPQAITGHISTSGAGRCKAAFAMNVMPSGLGWIEVICGPMFSGKSEELIRRLRRAQIARQPLQAFKPTIDDRYHNKKIVSHSAVSIDAVTVGTAQEIAERILPETRVVGIDEAQFFDHGVVDLSQRLADRGMRVVVAGLDQDYTGIPFGPMPALLAVAEQVTKALAICTRCGAPAGRSQRLVGSDASVQVGALESYEARCRRCHVPRVEPTTKSLFDTQNG